MAQVENVTLRDHLKDIKHQLSQLQGQITEVNVVAAKTDARLDELSPHIANVTPVIQVQERHSTHVKVLYAVVVFNFLAHLGALAWAVTK